MKALLRQEIFRFFLVPSGGLPILSVRKQAEIIEKIPKIFPVEILLLFSDVFRSFTTGTVPVLVDLGSIRNVLFQNIAQERFHITKKIRLQ